MFENPDFDHFDGDLKNFNPEFHKNEDTLKITVSPSNSSISPTKHRKRRPLLQAATKKNMNQIINVTYCGNIFCQTCFILTCIFIFLILKGRYVDAGANQVDYRVTIGTEDCPLIGPPVTNAIICEPPQEKPEGTTKSGGVQVVVNNFSTDFILSMFQNIVLQ